MRGKDTVEEVVENENEKLDLRKKKVGPHFYKELEATNINMFKLIFEDN